MNNMLEAQVAAYNISMRAKQEKEAKEFDFLWFENGTVVKGRLENGDTRVFTLGRDRRWRCGAWSMDQHKFSERVRVVEILA